MGGLVCSSIDDKPICSKPLIPWDLILRLPINLPTRIMIYMTCKFAYNKCPNYAVVYYKKRLIVNSIQNEIHCKPQGLHSYNNVADPIIECRYSSEYKHLSYNPFQLYKLFHFHNPVVSWNALAEDDKYKTTTGKYLIEYKRMDPPYTEKTYMVIINISQAEDNYIDQLLGPTW